MNLFAPRLRSAQRLRSGSGDGVEESPRRIWPLRFAAVLLPILALSAPVFGAIPVGPFCGDIGGSALQQSGTLTQDGITSVCGTDKTCPGSSGPNVPYVAFPFTNDTGVDVCLTVSGSSTCTGNSRSTLVAYLGSFDPSNVCTNYLADSGDQLGSGTAVEFSAIVPAGQSFVIVAAAAKPGNDCGAFCFTLSAEACTITCPDNIVVGTGPGSTQCGANVEWDLGVPCGGTPTCTANGNSVASGSFFPVGTTTVTCSLSGAQCSFDVTVNDTTPPAVTCPVPVTLPANGSCQATVPNVLGGVTVSDNCATADAITLSQSPTAGTIVGVGKTTVTVTADDGTNQSTCTVDVNVVDTTAPQITCPANITVSAPAGACSATVNYTTPTATDACGPANVVCLPASGSSFPSGQTTVTCTATDGSNNQAQCTFTITVNGASPAITCPANITASASPDACSAVVNYTTPTSCAGATVGCVPASGSTFPVGETTVTCTATAGTSSAECTFTVTVNDTTPPTITCPPDVNAFADANGTSKPVSYPAPDFGDNCPGATVQCVPASGSTFPLGDTVVTCTATDAHQNTNQCTFTVSVRANPVIPTLDPRALAALAAAVAAAGAILARRR